MGREDYNAGKVGFVVHTHLTGTRHAQFAGINSGIVPMPRGPHAERHFYPAFAFTMSFLPVNAENPKALVALHSYLYRENDLVETLDMLISSFTNSYEDSQIYLEAAERWSGEGDVFQNAELWTIVNDPIGKVLAGEMDASIAMDGIAQEAQRYLDTLFGQ